MLALAAALYAGLYGRHGSVALNYATTANPAVVQEEPVTAQTSAQPREVIEFQAESRGSLRTLPQLEPLSATPALAGEVTPSAPVDVLPFNLSLTPTATATPTADELCEPSDSPAFCIYTVQEGDTLSSISALFDLDGSVLAGYDMLARSNIPEVTSVEDYIQPGQKLRVPVEPGIVHTVLLGETVGDLAEYYDVTSEAIIEANDLDNPDFIPIGEVLLIPDPQQLEPPPPPEPTATPEAEGEDGDGEGEGPQGEPEPEPTIAQINGFIWPITAPVRITNYMSGRHPLGIDLGLGHAPGSPIVAVLPGRVTFAGGNPCCSYGYYVIVDHGDGLKTLYAHLSSIQVSVGQFVTQGTILGPSGSTGYSTGVHLHFEVHKNGTRVDPMAYLP